MILKPKNFYNQIFKKVEKESNFFSNFNQDISIF